MSAGDDAVAAAVPSWTAKSPGRLQSSTQPSHTLPSSLETATASVFVGSCTDSPTTCAGTFSPPRYSPFMGTSAIRRLAMIWKVLQEFLLSYNFL